jgi:hypothetical protein
VPHKSLLWVKSVQLTGLGCHCALTHSMTVKLQQQQQQLHHRCRAGPTPFTARRPSRRVLPCNCSISPDQQLEQALQPSSRSSSGSISSNSTQQCPPAQPVAAAPGLQVKRRDAVVVPVLGGMALQLAGLLQPQQAAASKLGEAADSAWEAMGGGPADLTFPDSW